MQENLEALWGQIGVHSGRLVAHVSHNDLPRPYFARIVALTRAFSVSLLLTGKSGRSVRLLRGKT